MNTSRNVGLVLNDEELTEKEEEIIRAASVIPEKGQAIAQPESGDSSMEQKKSPPRIRVQRTFRIYPELLEALGTSSAKRKQAGYEQWSQDAIINHALKMWLEQYGD